MRARPSQLAALIPKNFRWKSSAFIIEVDEDWRRGTSLRSPGSDLLEN